MYILFVINYPKLMKNKGFTLIELLVVVAIIGILTSIGIFIFSGSTNSAKIVVAKANHREVVKQFETWSVQCFDRREVKYTKIIYFPPPNSPTTFIKGCLYSDGWNLVMDLGYNHFLRHFQNEWTLNKRFPNPYTNFQGVQWNNGCSPVSGETVFYGYGNNTSDFAIWTNTGDGGACLFNRVNFPLRTK